MPYVASIDTCLPRWESPDARVPGAIATFLTAESSEAESTTLGGSLPVHTSVNLMAKGRPPGATGVGQCVELFAQLRGDAVKQVDGARIALAHDIGGPTAVSAVTILEGPAANGG